MPLTMLHFSGRDYLAEICCGQETKLYQLQNTDAQLDPDGKVVVPTVKDTAKSEYDQVSNLKVPDASISCYAAKAVPYLLTRCADYIETMRNIAQFGIDLVAGEYDEAANGALILADLLGTGTAEVRDLLFGEDPEVVRAAILSEEVETAMIDAWTYDGTLNRFQLIWWATKCPWSVDGIRILPLVVYWASNSLIWGYNDQLTLYGQECITGNSVDDIPVGYEYYERESGGITYPVYVYTPNVTLVSGGTSSWTVPISSEMDIVALYGKLQFGSGGMSEAQLYCSNEGGYLNTAPDTVKHYGTRSAAFAAFDTVAEEFIGTAPQVLTNGSASSPPRILGKVPFYSDISILQVVAVGEAL